MPLVTLVLANGPGFPLGSADHRYELSVALTPGGQLDVAAWLADPEPWPATRYRPGEAPRPGDVQWDEEGGWSLRIFAQGSSADAPLQAQIRNAGQLRPGEYLTIQDQGGPEFSWRVVSTA